MLEIDGSQGEGGGQILRTALSLAAITGQQIAIRNVRAGRERPGLRPQHLTAALAVSEICDGDLDGAEVGSTVIEFRPGKVRPGSYVFDVSRARASAGSVNLIFQTVLWPLAFAGKPSKLVIKGGTHVPFAPVAEYISNVFLPAVKRMGVSCEYELIRAGFYPTGGGEVRASINPVSRLSPLLARRALLTRVEVVSAVSNLPEHVAARQLGAAARRLRSLGIDSEERVARYDSNGKGSVLFISACGDEALAGFQSLGAPGKLAETVAEEACDDFACYLSMGLALDKHLADQLIIPAALASGESAFTTCEITGHLLTNIAVVQKFITRGFHVSAGAGEPGEVRTFRD